MTNDKIYVTGAGVISAIGNNVDENLRSLRGGQSGIAPVVYLDTCHKHLPVGEVKLTNAQLAERVHCDAATSHYRTVLLGIHAAREAVTSAALDAETLRRAAFINGTTVGGMDYTEVLLNTAGETALTADLLMQNSCGGSTEMIAENVGDFKIKSTISTACSSAANAIIYGANLIKTGVVDVAVVGGTESLSKFHFNGFKTLMILDSERCKPFDNNRNGINLGEGAAYIVLESAASAARRGAKALAVLSGYGNACDAFHQTATSPEAEGAYQAMTKALTLAELKPEDIDYINCHGTGTPNNDMTELAAMHRVWGEKIPAFSSTKGFTGHTTSASGSIEAIYCIFALQHKLMPANINTTDVIDGGESLLTGNRESEVRNALCNSFGFGGNDSSLIFSATDKK